MQIMKYMKNILICINKNENLNILQSIEIIMSYLKLIYVKKLNIIINTNLKNTNYILYLIKYSRLGISFKYYN